MSFPPTYDRRDRVLLLDAQIRPDESVNIPVLSAGEVSHASQRVCAKDVAPENMLAILTTLDTGHLAMSQLNDDAEANI